MASYTTVFMSLLLDRVLNYHYLYPEQPNSTIPAVDLLALNRRATIPTGYPNWMHTARCLAKPMGTGQTAAHRRGVQTDTRRDGSEMTPVLPPRA